MFHSGPWLLEDSKIVVHMTACDSQSSSSHGATGHGLPLASVPLAALRCCSVEDMPCRMPSWEKEAVWGRLRAHPPLRGSGQV